MMRLILILLLLPTLCWGQVMSGTVFSGGSVGVTAAAPCTGADQNVGNPTLEGDADGILTNYVSWNGSDTFTTPAGVTNICTLAGSFKYAVAAANVRIAVYSEDGATLICQGSPQKAVPTINYTTVSWTYGESELTGTCTVSGSTNYKIAATADNGAGTGAIYLHKTTGASGISRYDEQDMTGGFGAYTLPAGSAGTAKIKVWMGVQ